MCLGRRGTENRWVLSSSATWMTGVMLPSLLPFRTEHSEGCLPLPPFSYWTGISSPLPPPAVSGSGVGQPQGSLLAIAAFCVGKMGMQPASQIQPSRLPAWKREMLAEQKRVCAELSSAGGISCPCSLTTTRAQKVRAWEWSRLELRKGLILL